jgi:sulfite exporter TauE/SafE
MVEKPDAQSASSQERTEAAACPQCGPTDAAAPGSRLRHYGEIAGIFVVVAAAYLLLRRFDLQGGLAVSDHLTYGLVFLIGLAASVSTCMAVTGGLLLAVAAKYDAVSAATAPATKFKLHLYFNAGRLIGYAVLGGVIGALGSALAFSAEVNGVLMLAASVIMVMIGLQLIGLLPSFGLARVVPAAWLEWVRSNSARQSGPAAALLGASTFFFPCGFTQALQLYVLAQASATIGALTMLIFALGTLPALLSLSAITSFARGAIQRYLLKFAGALLILLALVNVQYGLLLTGLETSRTPQTATVDRVPVVGGAQVASMKIVGLDYSPNRFSVQQGIPVTWRIDATEADGCGVVLIVPKLGIRRLLATYATNIVKFTPSEPGDIEFNCGMGMMTPDSKFTVVPASG